MGVKNEANWLNIFGKIILNYSEVILCMSNKLLNVKDKIININFYKPMEFIWKKLT